MASPFAVFRRNRKAMMVALTVMVMFGFVFIPMMMEAMGNRAGADPVVVTTARYGSLTQSQVNRLVQRNARLTAVIRDLGQAVLQAQGRAEEANTLLFHLRTNESDPGPGVVRLWALARYAEELGMVVDDRAINDYLSRLTEKRVKPFVIEDVLKRYGMRESEFFDLLHEALLAKQLVESVIPAVGIITPAQQWDFFQRIRRQAKIELTPVPVRNYLGQVAEPSEAELKAFFEEHRNRPWPPYSPTPGFFQPAKVRVRYITADLESIAEKSITEAEIMAQYEQDKERYDRQNRPRIDLGAPGETSQPSGAAAPSGSPASGDAAPSTESPATPSAAPKAQEESKSSSASSTPPSDGSNKASKPDTDEQKEPASGSQPQSDFRRFDGRNPQTFRLASMGDDRVIAAESRSDEPSAGGENMLPNESKPSENAPSDSATQASNAAGDQKGSSQARSQEGKESEVEPASAQSGEQMTQPSPNNSGTERSPVGDSPAEPKPNAPPPASPPTGPTEEIKRQIRNELAAKKIDELFNYVSRQLTQYRERKITGQEKVEPPDFTTWAQQNRLVQTETDLLPEWDLRRIELAEAMAESGGSFVESVFGQRLFIPTRGFDLRGRQFIWWTTEEVKAYAPKWDDRGVRDRVLEGWKLVKAREIARHAAEKLAAEARKAGKPLKEVFAGRADVEVFDPPEFTWMTAGSVAPLLSVGRLEVSSVAGVEWPGHEFMRTTFDLAPGEVGIAMNQPQTFVYVIRVVDFTPSDNVLWESFTTLDTRHYAQIVREEAQARLFAWFADIENAIGLKWLGDYRHDGPSE